jgi:hypothetical protein
MSVITYDTRSATRTDISGVDLVDQLVGYAGGRAALTVLGWPNPAEGSEDDVRHERMLAIQLAHLSPHGRATDLEYLDSIVEAGLEEALRLAREHWEAIAALATELSQQWRLAGTDLDAALDRAMLAVPAVREQEAAFQRDFERLQVRLGFARRTVYA